MMTDGDAEALPIEDRQHLRDPDLVAVYDGAQDLPTDQGEKPVRIPLEAGPSEPFDSSKHCFVAPCDGLYLVAVDVDAKYSSTVPSLRLFVNGLHAHTHRDIRQPLAFRTTVGLQRHDTVSLSVFHPSLVLQPAGYARLEVVRL